MISHDTSKAMLVGSKRIRGDVCIPAIILRPDYRVAITKPVQLLGVDPKHHQPALQKGFDHWSPRNLAGNGNMVRFAVPHFIETPHEIADRLAAVIDPVLTKNLTSSRMLKNGLGQNSAFSLFLLPKV